MKKNTLILFITLLFLLSASNSSAQVAGQTETIGVPWNGTPGISVSVADITAAEQARPASKTYTIRFPGREFEVDRSSLRNKPVSQTVSSWPPMKAGERLNDVTGLLSPQQVGVSFQGAQISETAGYVPPDIVGDVGPTQVLIHVNGRIRVFNKSGAVGGLDATEAVFWQSVRGSDGVSDPHVRYDPISGRWFLCIITIPASGANKVLVAVSSGPTITNTSSFTFFQFQQDLVGTTPNTDTGNFADYPTLGVDANALYVGVNMFDPSSSYAGSSVFVIRKSALISGSLTVTPFRQVATTSTGPYTPQGVQNDDASATEGYFIGVDNGAFGQLDIRRVTNPGGTPSISSDIALTVPATQIPIKQVVKGSTTSHRLDALDDRLFAAQIKKNKISGVTSLWTAHNIQVNTSGAASASGGRNGSRWYEIRNMTSTPTLNQSGTVFSSASSNPIGYWIPSVAMSGQGHMALGCSYASTNDYASVAVTGRFSGDTPGTTQSITNALVASSAYNAETVDGQRWGDFTQTVVDPTDDMTMWTFQEYCNSTDSWALRAIQLIAPPPATPASASPPSVNTNVTNVDVVITGTSSSGSGFFDPGAGFANRLSAGVSGAGVTVNSVTFSSPTSITVNVSVASNAAAGARTITVTNPDGQQVTSATGILTVNGVSCPTITLAPTTLPNGAAGSSYNQTITASGGAASYTYAITTGALPAGVTLSSGGVLSGTPTFGGTYSFSVTATDANSCTGVQPYTLTITGCPQITLSPLTLPNGILGAGYNQTVTASGGTASYSYLVTTGALPGGLTLSSGGAISGTPTGTGTSNFTITTTDGNSCTGSQAYSITVNNCPTITLSPATLSNGTAGTAYNQTITASGGTASYSYAVTTGSLPGGLTLSSTGAISGSPLSSGTSNFTITATDANSCTGSQAYSLTIDANGNTISLTSSGTAYSQNFDGLASTGTSSIVPAGWAFSESGTASNTTYAADSGTTNSGNTYSYGNASSTDRAFGGLQSGSLTPTIGASFTNNTGGTITSLAISYTGEQWRLGNTARPDSLLFQYSTDATNLTTGTWTRYTTLHFPSPVSSGTVGKLNGNTAPNRTSISGTITGLSIANGAGFYIRWTDFNATGADDGLAVDDFSLMPTSSAPPTNPAIIAGANPATVAAGSPTLLTATITPGTNPASTGLGVTVNLIPVGGSATQTMYDDGTHGDAITSDNIYSYRDTIPSITTAGSKTLHMTVTDGQSRSADDSVAISVLPIGCPAITLGPSVLPDDTLGVAYSQSITASGGTAPYTFSLTGGSLPGGLSLSLSGNLTGSPAAADTFHFTVTATDTFGCTGSKAFTLFIADTGSAPPDTEIALNIPVLNRWNIVSNPLTTSSDSVAVIFPGAATPAFYYDTTGYHSSRVMQNGKGYWLKFGPPHINTIQGFPRYNDTLNIATGWNLIGSLSNPIPTSGLTISYPILQSLFFGYSNGYFPTDTLKPGMGYWVKSSGRGSIILSAPPPAKAPPARTKKRTVKNK